MSVRLTSILYSSQTLEDELSSAHRDIEALQFERSQLGVASGNQLSEIARLRHAEELCATLQTELRAADQTNTELRFRIAAQQRQLSAEGATGQEEVAEALRARLHKMAADVAAVTERNERQQRELDEATECGNLLQRALRDAGRMHRATLDENEALKAALAAASRTGGGSENFKDFVLVKRQLELVQDDNNELKARLKARGVAGLVAISGGEDGGAGDRENGLKEGRAADRRKSLADDATSTGKLVKNHRSSHHHLRKVWNQTEKIRTDGNVKNEVIVVICNWHLITKVWFMLSDDWFCYMVCLLINTALHCEICLIRV